MDNLTRKALIKGAKATILNIENGFISLSSETTYYLLAITGANNASIQFRGNLSPTLIKAVCAYL
jgi:hypothetical protein